MSGRFSRSGRHEGLLKSVERAAIEKVMHDTRFNKSKAAKLLGLTRAQLYVRLKKFGME